MVQEVIMLKEHKISMIQLVGWDDYRDYFNQKFSSVENKKIKLLEMARNGEPRPIVKKHPLGTVLNCYISKRGVQADPEFNKQIRKIATSWFIDTAMENKNELLQMARNGGTRPYRMHPLGKALSCYVCKSSGTYDPIFDKQIRKIATHWFVNTATENKKKLLEMAGNGEPKPHRTKHPLRSALKTYTLKSSSAYDPAFDKQIRKIATSWFIDTALENKKKLLQMARNGEPRPHWKKHPLGAALNCYISKRGVQADPEFNKQIRKIAPHWFKR